MKDLWYAPARSSRGPAFKSRPGLFTRQGQIEVLGSAGWVRGRGGTTGQNHSSTKSIARLDVQAASPTAKMADLTCRQFLLLPNGRLGALRFTTAFPALARLSAHCSFTSPFRRSLASQFHFLFLGARRLSVSLPLSRRSSPLCFTSFSRPLPLSERWAESPSERGMKKKNLSVHHHCTNNKQPLTPPDTHVTSILPNNLAKHAFNGVSELILYLVAC